MINCPNCGTGFDEKEAPWLQKKQHCPKHDFTFPQGKECPVCKAETEDAALKSKEGTGNGEQGTSGLDTGSKECPEDAALKSKEGTGNGEQGTSGLDTGSAGSGVSGVVEPQKDATVVGSNQPTEGKK